VIKDLNEFNTPRDDIVSGSAISENDETSEKINILDRNLSNMIAAGEVVDRPAGVIKELCENAVDAGATSVTVEIKGGGMALMRVTDNGCGMSPRDAKMCVLRHATSKIRTSTDLDAIETMGFRGEALAAISSVSRFSILTKRRCDESGTLLTVDESGEPKVTEAASPDGTSVTVEELFYNQPARKKFVKRDSTEFSAILSIVQRIAAANRNISFKLYNDGVLKLSTRGGAPLKDTVYAIFGKEFAGGLTEVEGETGGIKVSGLICTPENARASRSMQIFFVNTRPVKNKTMLFALEEAFKGYIKSDKFPSCVLFISMEPNTVDVNVHPTKAEVRFSDERMVYEAIYISVKNALMALVNPIAAARTDKEEEHRISIPRTFFSGLSSERNTPDGEKASSLFKKAEESDSTEENKSEKSHSGNAAEMTPSSEQLTVRPSVDFSSYKSALSPSVTEALMRTRDSDDRKETVLPLRDPSYPKKEEKDYRFTKYAGKEEAPQIQVAHLFPEETYVYPEEMKNAEKAEEEKTAETPVQSNIDSDEDYLFRSGRIRGSAFDAFIIYEKGDSLYFVDKHAAHERIIYESLKKTVTRDGSQQLIVPFIVTLTPTELNIICENASELERIGITVEPFGASEVAVRALPAELSELNRADVSAVIQLIAAELSAGGRASSAADAVLDRILYTMACKAAVKAGIPGDREESEWIVRKLGEIPNIIVCPHGRPVVFSVTRSQLEKMFFRT